MNQHGAGIVLCPLLVSIGEEGMGINPKFFIVSMREMMDKMTMDLVVMSVVTAESVLIGSKCAVGNGRNNSMVLHRHILRVVHCVAQPMSRI